METTKEIYTVSILHGVLQETENSMDSVVRWLRNFNGDWNRKVAHPKIYAVAIAVIWIKNPMSIGGLARLNRMTMDSRDYLRSLQRITL